MPSALQAASVPLLPPLLRPPLPWLPPLSVLWAAPAPVPLPFLHSHPETVATTPNFFSSEQQAQQQHQQTLPRQQGRPLLLLSPPRFLRSWLQVKWQLLALRQQPATLMLSP